MPKEYPFREGPRLTLSSNPIIRNPEELRKPSNWDEYVCLLPELYFEKKDFQQAYESALVCMSEGIGGASLDPKALIKYALYAKKANKTIELTLAYLNRSREPDTHLNASLIIAYLLNEQLDVAEKLILQWRNQDFSNGKNAHAFILGKITNLEVNGILHNNFQRAKQLLK